MDERAKFHLRRIHRDIRRTCEAYDNGDLSAAYSLSNFVSMIALSSRRQTSLLEQVEVENEAMLRDTSEVGDFAGQGFPMVAVKVSVDHAPFVSPLLDQVAIAPERSLAEWKKGKVAPGFSPERFIKVMRNQDGGAHVDPTVKDKQYSQISKEFLVGFSYSQTDSGYVLKFQGSELHLVLQALKKGESLPGPKEPFKPIPFWECAIARQISEEVSAYLDQLHFL